jgi:NADPH:quinone reductase
MDLPDKGQVHFHQLSIKSYEVQLLVHPDAFLFGFTVVKPFTKVVSYHEIALAAAHQSGDIQAQKNFAVIGDHMLSLLSEGKLDAMLKEVISLEEIPDALNRLSERHVKGKIVAKLK